MNADLYSELFGLVTLLDDRNAETTLGSIHAIDKEPLRFHNISQLTFPEPPRQRVVEEKNEQTGETCRRTYVDNAIFGLLGPIGPLPYIYSEMEARATRDNETDMRDLFDIFSHRSTSLMYRAWRKNRSSLENQPGAAKERQRQFSAMLEGFTGVSDLPERIAWLELERKQILSCADVFTRRVRSAGGLQRLLNRQFRLRFEIEEFVGNWESLPDEAKTSLGAPDNPPRLGYNTIIGNRTWQAQSTFRVVIRHPSASDYQALQPGSESLRRMQLVIQLYCPAELSFRIHIIVNGSAIKPGSLGDSKTDASETGDSEPEHRGREGAMLGWNTVLGQPNPNRDYAFSICRNYNESRMKP